MGEDDYTKWYILNSKGRLKTLDIGRSSEGLMQQSERYWSTNDIVGARALRYWSDVVAEGMIGCQINSDDVYAFRASLASYSFGVANFHLVQSSPSDIRRTRECISRRKNDYYYLIHHRRAEVAVEQHGRTAVVGPGDCVLVSGRSPYRIQNRETMEGISIAIPTDLLLGWIPEPDVITARTLHGAEGWGHSLAATLANFEGNPPAQLALSTSVVVDQILAHFAIAAGSDVTSSTRHQRALLRRLADTLSDRFCEPNFDPSRLAEEHGLSKRYVHMIFAKAGTSFGRELERIRLERAKRLLEDRRFNSIDIMEIALRCGFRDSSGFSKRFRGRYGTPPSLYRRLIGSDSAKRAIIFDQTANCS